ncbi:hypothetical protein I7G85_24900 [Sinorhizobium meliloti]|nr:hypothetical protein [Sinorhizobium meliloti]
MAPSKTGASVHLSGAPPSSGNFEALKHLLKLNVLQTKLLGELAPQHFDFFVETCHFIEKQVTLRRGWQALIILGATARCVATLTLAPFRRSRRLIRGLLSNFVLAALWGTNEFASAPEWSAS